jgi:hypothetical protein
MPARNNRSQEKKHQAATRNDPRIAISLQPSRPGPIRMPSISAWMAPLERVVLRVARCRRRFLNASL